MRPHKIYTAGKMTGLSFDEQMKWRNLFASQVLAYADLGVNITFIHPPLYWDTGASNVRIDKEAMTWDLAQLRSSDIVAVNLKDINSSIGTHFELATVIAANSTLNHHIYIVGFGQSDDEELHPWIANSIEFLRKDSDDAAEFIASNLLI